MIYVHIGTVKTGTTYLQKIFYQNAKVFERFGVAYPFVFPPALDLPRYANAQFLVDRSRDDQAHNTLKQLTLPNALISDEGIFVHLSQLRHPAFEGLSTKVILYVRRPAELILSWVAEVAEPYNAFSRDYATGIGPLEINVGIELLSQWYDSSVRAFIEFASRTGTANIIVRPFESESLIDGDLLADFLHCMGIRAEDVRSDPEFCDPGVTNESRSRKFSDISYAAWFLLGKPNTPSPYDVSLIEEITSVCESGDTRPVIETVDDDMIEYITKRFAYFEAFLSEHFLGGAPFFQMRYPSIYGKQRAPYRPINLREIRLLIDLIILRREMATAAVQEDTRLTAPDK